LPLLAADRTLRLAALPAGEDPDTLVRRGAPAFQPVLDAARPLAEALFDIVREATGEATPEQRAALRTRLEEAAARIRDKALASEYRRALLDRFYQRRAPGPYPGPGRRGSPAPRPLRIARPVPGADIAEAERCRTLMAILLRHPNLLHDVEEAFAAVALPPPLARLREELGRWAAQSQTLDSDALITHLTTAGLAAEAAQALSAVPYPLPACALPEAQPAQAEAGWWHIFGFLDPGGLEEEVAAATLDFARHPDEAAQRRLIALCTARDALRRGEQGLDADP